MASAYLIHVDPPSGYADPNGMAQYAGNVGAIVESFGGIYHARHKSVRVLEGPWRPELELRRNAGDGTLVIFEGSRSLDDFDV
jgi:uncharacterized protein (DUF1330 family)